MCFIAVHPMLFIQRRDLLFVFPVNTKEHIHRAVPVNNTLSGYVHSGQVPKASAFS